LLAALTALFMGIGYLVGGQSGPLSGAGMDNLFSTHPNVENRIARLNEIARQMGQL
jgi:Zn-dependent protease with chaperone function